uniref:Uncharacterized protein n=1 Tax=Physcomitrium patens TaxID=3218 RepID=A0A2K1L1M0_PHYPA|nr:hypothetical protein PHYPA_002716 [Physcomitrium patens]
MVDLVLGCCNKLATIHNLPAWIRASKRSRSRGTHRARRGRHLLWFFVRICE